MTTETQRAPRRGVVSVLVGAAASAAVLGLLAAGLGLLVAGSAAAYGAVAGTLLVLTVLGFGSFVVNAVAGLMPAAALLVALLTYTLQVVAMALAFVALSGSGLLDDAVDRRWLAGAVILGTLGWLTSQVLLTTRLRIPAYDLPAPPSPAPGAGAPRERVPDRREADDR